VLLPAERRKRIPDLVNRDGGVTTITLGWLLRVSLATS